MKKSNSYKIVISETLYINIIVQLVLFMFSMWLIDVSVTTLNFGGVLTNGVVVRDPALMYHIGVALAVISFMVVVFLFVQSYKVREVD